MVWGIAYPNNRGSTANNPAAPQYANGSRRMSMPLMSCPVCQQKVSTAAEACPQCGHPLQEKRRDPHAVRCYACESDATTRCQSCGVASCVRHVDSIYVSHGRGG